jgi:hypothetical protein
MSDSIIQLFDTLATARTEEVQVITPKGIAPTRKAVVEDLAEDCIVGGANHFPVTPTQDNTSSLDDKLAEFSDGEEFHIVDASLASELLQLTGNNELGGIPSKVFEESLKNINQDGKVLLVVRRGRGVSANTGTLLSPDDRKLASRYKKDSVLIIYRLTGETTKGWDGKPFWIPNVKLPSDKVVYFK